MVQAPNVPREVLAAFVLLDIASVLKFTGGWHKVHPVAAAELKERINKIRCHYGGFPVAHPSVREVLMKVASEMRCRRILHHFYLRGEKRIDWLIHRQVSVFLRYEDDLRQAIAELESQGIPPVTILRKRSQDGACAAV